MLCSLWCTPLTYRQDLQRISITAGEVLNEILLLLCTPTEPFTQGPATCFAKHLPGENSPAGEAQYQREPNATALSKTRWRVLPPVLQEYLVALWWSPSVTWAWGTSWYVHVGNDTSARWDAPQTPPGRTRTTAQNTWHRAPSPSHSSRTASFAWAQSYWKCHWQVLSGKGKKETHEMNLGLLHHLFFWKTTEGKNIPAREAGWVCISHLLLSVCKRPRTPVTLGGQYSCSRWSRTQRTMMRWEDKSGSSIQTNFSYIFQPAKCRQISNLPLSATSMHHRSLHLYFVPSLKYLLQGYNGPLLQLIENAQDR